MYSVVALVEGFTLELQAEINSDMLSPKELRKEVRFHPCLSNLVLDELDRELDRRGHRYVRYADDCNICVRSQRAGQRVMEGITRFITHKLKLKVNESKSAVARPQERKFFGFSFSAGPEVKRIIAPKALERFNPLAVQPGCRDCLRKLNQ